MNSTNRTGQADSAGRRGTAARAEHGPQQHKKSSLSRGLCAAAGILALVGFLAAAQPAAAQSASVKAGKKRPIESLATLEVQAGGDELASVQGINCSSGQSGRQCTRVQSTLRAGDGVGLGVGALIPLGRSRADLELVFGISHSSLSSSSSNSSSNSSDSGRDNLAFVSRYYLRSQLMFTTRTGIRIGGGLVSHLKGKYKIYSQGPARRFDPAIGVRFQMEWLVGLDAGMGFYLQSMDYSTGSTDSISASGVGFITTFHFR